jgi:hypothetical protein
MATEFQAEELEMADPSAETVRIRVLPESLLRARPGSEPAARSFDPYSTDNGAMTAPAKPRRTLDDMRRLSETIVRNRRCSK